MKRLTELALLTALALIIFIIELRIPELVPIPGVKLGLANIITVYAVYHYKAQETALMVLCRVAAGIVFSAGSMTTLLYSLSGALFLPGGYAAAETGDPGKTDLALQRFPGRCFTIQARS